jgi:hypothetical protein
MHIGINIANEARRVMHTLWTQDAPQYRITQVR